MKLGRPWKTLEDGKVGAFVAGIWMSYDVLVWINGRESSLDDVSIHLDWSTAFSTAENLIVPWKDCHMLEIPEPELLLKAFLS